MPSVDAELRAMKDKLRSVGLRATGPRIAVLTLLREAKSAVTHGDLAEKLAVRGIDRATVYRNLVDLTEAGLARRSDMGDHVWRFELVSARGAHADVTHAHFLCSGCGVVACLPDDAVTIAGARGLPRSVKRKQIQIEVRGLCDQCA
jgi:Fur family ferric uptake transcriptional regulator